MESKLILVNDCSPDGTWKTIQSIASTVPRCLGINLAFNTGQFRATFCGLQQVQDKIIVTMDDDLQQPPEEIPALVNALEAPPECDAVFARIEVRSMGCFVTWGRQ